MMRNIKEEILSCTNIGLEIFYFYMPIDFVPKKNFRNPLYDDRNASCNIYLDRKSDCYRMKDFGNDAYSGDCFWFASVMLHLDVRRDFKQVLQNIIHDLQLNISAFEKQHTETPIRTIPKSRSVKTTPLSADQPIKRKFKLTEQPFKKAEIAYWLQYGIDLTTLQRYNVKSLARYDSISQQGKPFTLNSSDEEPMFCYHMGGFVKIYRPKSKLRFLYGGKKSEDYVFGFEQLPNKGDVLFVTGGEKDVMSLSSHHFNAICFNSETARISETAIESLQLRFRHIVLLFDTDEERRNVR